MNKEFSETEQRELQKFLENENAKAQIQRSIHTFTDLCWDKCIGKIGNKLDRGEEQCLSNCVERFLDTSLFIVKRLEEVKNQL
ncbi:Tim10/DDP family zinc finger-domain-containing protein [Endogone sp. FLAS-F59071]|nr:Tim10/DDP family zinc finger-domain-containing protein [Endogone sp. FLAS-F59071]|eukprot:RUS22980.1 Tim10/DDP family zinc finger-domain-containing protein [Endogone sp. FLAS-F59071]